MCAKSLVLILYFLEGWVAGEALTSKKKKVLDKSLGYENNKKAEMHLLNKYLLNVI